MADAIEHDVIWLQPWCDHCEWCDQGESGGRQWCQDDVWGKCDDCDRVPVKYVRERLTP